METLISFSTGVCHTTMQADLSVWLFNLLYMSYVSRNSQILKIMFPSRNVIIVGNMKFGKSLQLFKYSFLMVMRFFSRCKQIFMTIWNHFLSFWGITKLIFRFLLTFFSLLFGKLILTKFQMSSQTCIYMQIK